MLVKCFQRNIKVFPYIYVKTLYSLSTNPPYNKIYNYVIIDHLSLPYKIKR